MPELGFRLPLAIDPVLDDPDVVRSLLESTAPHFPVQRYFQSGAEMKALSGPAKMIIGSNFRADWATASEKVSGVDVLLESSRLRDAAAKLFETEHVYPWGVYCNVTWQLPYHQGTGHTDVPAFLGFDRTRYPTWLLNVMGHSRLFEAERVDIATAVAWFYRGTDGGFTYWLDGPNQPPTVHEGSIFNTGFMGDNDRMYHTVRPVGSKERGLVQGMTLNTTLEPTGAGGWRICDDGATLAEMPFDELRISVSWKAYVYRDAEHRERHLSGDGGLSLEDVLERFGRDLEHRNISFEPPADPLHDESFVDVLTEAYVQTPTVFKRAQAK